MLKMRDSSISQGIQRGNAPKIKSLEEELLETRMLYSCTLEDMDIVSLFKRTYIYHLQH